MRVFGAAALIALLAGPAFAQSVPKYGDVDKAKSPQEIEQEHEADKAYQKSLGNIPDKGPSDPWGNVRSDNPPKAPTTTVTKTPVAKTTATKPVATKPAQAKPTKTTGAN
jgi:hypothetical protein